MRTRFSPPVFLLSVAALLSACGGGSGSSDSASTSTTTSGYASKGIIKGAKVYVCRITGGAVQADASCSTGTTGTDGSYSVSLTDGWTGPVLVKVMPATNSTMMNELTGEDETFDVTDGIRAVVASAGTVAQVTPFSEIAASAAVAAGTVDTTAVNQANAMVQNNFGVDLSTKPVVDLKESSSDSATLGKQIAMVQKLAQIVNAGKNGQFKDPTTGLACTSVSCGIKAMKAIAPSTTSIVATSGTTNSMSTMNTVFNTTVTVNVPIRKSDGSISVQTIDPSSSSSIQTKLLAAGLTDAASLAASIKSNLDQDVSNGLSTRTQVVAAAGSDGKMTYTPPSTTAMAAVEQAKTMAKFMREAFNRFSNSSKTGYLDKQKTRMEAEVATLVRPDIDRSVSRLATVQMAIELFDAASGTDSSSVETFTSGGKTYYKKYSDTLGNVLTGGRDMNFCVAEKVTGATTLTEVSCYNAYGNSGFTQSTADFNGVTSDSTTKVVGKMDIIGFKVKPTSTSSPVTAFTYGALRQQVAVVASANNVNNKSAYYIAYQPVGTMVSGAYNFSKSTGVNTYTSSCFTSVSAGYVASTYTDGVGTTCSAYVGVGTISRTVSSSGKTTALTLTGDLPPSNPGNKLNVGYDNVSVNYSAVDQGGDVMRYNISGYTQSYETPVSATSVQVDTAQVVKYAFSEGSYVQTKQTKNSSGNVTSESGNAMNLIISYTGYKSSGTGILTASDWKFDKNNVKAEPGTVVFDGTVSDLSTGGDGDVLKGKLTYTRATYGNVDLAKDIGYQNDDGTSMSFVGSVNAKNSADYIKASISVSRVFNSSNVPIDTATIKFEIAGGFVLDGTGVSNVVKDKDGTIKLKNQDGIRFWGLPDTVPTIYASDETTVLGKYKAGSGGKAFYFVDGSIISLN